MRSIRPKNCITFQERYSEQLADWQSASEAMYAQ